LPENLKIKMLHFMTGTFRAPVGGLGSVTLTISRDANRAHVPVAHTCQLKLDLPDIRDDEKVRKNLMICIENCQGFGVV
jgi:hypothetical protein